MRLILCCSLAASLLLASCKNGTEGPLSPLPRRAATSADSFTVAAIQSYSVINEPDSNRARFGVLTEEAARNGAQVIVLPEAAIPGYMDFTITRAWCIDGRRVFRGLTAANVDSVAEQVPGPSTEYFAAIASRYHAYVVVPIIEIDPTTREYFNTAVVLNTTGSILLHYRKLNPWFWAERGWASKGDHGTTWFESPWGRMSVIICFDINFELPHLKALGIEHLLYPIAWVDGQGSDWFSVRLPALAASNQMNVIGANWSVPDGFPATWYGYGQSVIADCHGAILAHASTNTGSEIIYARLGRCGTAAR
jgi:predicted amidohydrolase